MRNLLIPLLTAFALPTAVIAEVSQVSKSRPAWMEEKIKGCQKYPTKTQRDYCINVYSPYKSTIPNNSSRKELKNNTTNSITKNRPKWMEEKIKGCASYKEKAKRENCIKVYSPYGNIAPLNVKNYDPNAKPNHDHKWGTLKTTKNKSTVNKGKSGATFLYLLGQFFTGYSQGRSGGGYQPNFNSINLQNQINSQKFNNNLNNNANRVNQELMRNQQFNMQQQQNINKIRMQQNQNWNNRYNYSPYKY